MRDSTIRPSVAGGQPHRFVHLEREQRVVVQQRVASARLGHLLIEGEDARSLPAEAGVLLERLLLLLGRGTVPAWSVCPRNLLLNRLLIC